MPKIIGTVLITALIICCSISHAHAAQKPPLRERVVAVRADGSVMLERSGNAAFEGLLFPDIARANAWLAAQVLQQEITFQPGDEDRYGRTQITSDVAEKMLRDGAAMFYASDDNIAADLKAAEASARSAKRGLWGDKNFVLTAENAAQHIGAFHVVEGRITRIYEAKKATYLNFGDDWHSDFSITIPAKARRSMKALLPQLKAGQMVRVRGAIYEENGPMITLLKADNLELR